MPSKKKEPDWAVELQKQHLASLEDPPDHSRWKPIGWKHDNNDATYLLTKWTSGEIDYKDSDYKGLYSSDPRWWKYSFRNFADNINNLRKRHHTRLSLNKQSKSGENTTPKASNCASSVDTSEYMYMYMYL